MALYLSLIHISLSETQRVVMHQSKDIDIVIPARGREEAHIVTFFVRDGKLTGREVHELDMMPEAERSEMVSAFINQYYSSQPNLPKEILLTDLPGDSDVLEEYLTGIAGHNVKLLRPQKGEKKALVDMASKDVVEMVKTIDEKAALARERRYAPVSYTHLVFFPVAAGGQWLYGQSCICHGQAS